MIATGIVLASLEQTDDDVNRRSTKAIVLAFGAALSFGVSLYSVGHVSGDVAFAWLLIPARLVGVVVITLPLAIRGTLRIARRATPLVVGAGVAEVIGVASFAWGAQDSIWHHVGPGLAVRGDLGRRRVLLLRRAPAPHPGRRRRGDPSSGVGLLAVLRIDRHVNRGPARRAR